MKLGNTELGSIRGRREIDSRGAAGASVPARRQQSGMGPQRQADTGSKRVAQVCLVQGTCTPTVIGYWASAEADGSSARLAARATTYSPPAASVLPGMRSCDSRRSGPLSQAVLTAAGSAAVLFSAQSQQPLCFVLAQQPICF